MNIIKTDIDGVLIIEPRLFRDSRGYFFESFSEREFEEKVAPILGHSVLSEKDTKHVMLKDFDSPFDINVNLYQE